MLMEGHNPQNNKVKNLPPDLISYYMYFTSDKAFKTNSFEECDIYLFYFPFIKEIIYFRMIFHVSIFCFLLLRLKRKSKAANHC